MSLVTPHGGESIEKPLPMFTMPGCLKHIFTHYRWWCGPCRREAALQFELVCIAHWSEQRALKRIAGAEGTSADVLRAIAFEELL